MKNKPQGEQQSKQQSDTSSSQSPVADQTGAKEPLGEYATDSAIAELSYALAISGRSVEGIANIVLNYARSLTWSEHGYVSIIDEETGNNICLTLTIMIGDSCIMPNNRRGLVFPIQADGKYPRLWGHSLNTRTSFFTNNPAEHEASAGLPKSHIPVRNFLSVPVLLGNNLLGQISLANALNGYTDADLRIIERIAVNYALTVAKQKEADFQKETQERRFLEEKLKLVRDHNRKTRPEKETDNDSQLEELTEEIRTLNSLVKKRDTEKRHLETSIRQNIEKLILPNLKKLETDNLSRSQQMHLEAVHKSLEEIFSPLAARSNLMNIHLTPQEIQIATLVKSGMQTKEISQLLNISNNAVHFHRKNIRTKFRLNNKSINLQSYLQSLEEL
ncbi:MAG: GAF domain-containing protein [Proteobacteria bacterium]|nr:GAF domain-containing protein [Pseudomonadota bacterium]MBU1139521.1 GAF domain-containing protein [Pseudomonadota bacterium]